MPENTYTLVPGIPQKPGRLDPAVDQVRQLLNDFHVLTLDDFTNVVGLRVCELAGGRYIDRELSLTDLEDLKTELRDELAYLERTQGLEFSTQWVLRVPDDFNHPEVTVEGTVNRGPLGTAVVFSVGTDVFLRSLKWFHEYYEPQIPVLEPDPAKVEEDTPEEEAFFNNLGTVTQWGSNMSTATFNE